MNEQSELLHAILEEQRKTNQLLMLLVQTLAEEADDVDNQEPGVYLDGTPTSNA